MGVDVGGRRDLRVTERARDDGQLFSGLQEQRHTILRATTARADEREEEDDRLDRGHRPSARNETQGRATRLLRDDAPDDVRSVAVVLRVISGIDRASYVVSG